MAEKLDHKDTVSFEELFMSQMIQIDTLCQLLIEKGIITESEIHSKLKAVQAEYQKRKRKA